MSVVRCQQLHQTPVAQRLTMKLTNSQLTFRFCNTMAITQSITPFPSRDLSSESLCPMAARPHHPSLAYHRQDLLGYY